MVMSGAVYKGGRARPQQLATPGSACSPSAHSNAASGEPGSPGSAAGSEILPARLLEAGTVRAPGGRASARCPAPAAVPG